MDGDRYPYQFIIADEDFGRVVKITLRYFDYDKQKPYYCTVDPATKEIVQHELDDSKYFSIQEEPFISFKLPNMMSRQRQHLFLKALANALAEAKIYPELDNKERIVAEALADERKKQLEKTEGWYNNLVNRLLK